uniref:Parathyroid hormone/parathyroid hormone-related peptide receptor-like n=1 Tax=Crassostrea virginica TaxID=6565 RepID=A0A8B8BTJ6_CRAVI|nr:parathyroid hormone/parathyroid hormone-related peptide receptor-like [Crassostrea virginica]XP_022306677.1 parathyroid hormone/parathyroid hormone-related peptide receptor-like [Crassostrea virginica]
MNMTLNTTVDYNRTDNMLVPSEEKEYRVSLLQQTRRRQEEQAKCNLLIQQQAEQTTDLLCPPVWDHVMCWNSTEAGTTALQPCPNYIHRFLLNGVAKRTCTENGTWYVNPATNRSWTDFSGCTFEEQWRQSLNQHLDRIQLMSIIGYSISLVSLTVAVGVLLQLRYRSVLHCKRKTSNITMFHLNLFLAYILRASTAILKNYLLMDGFALYKDLQYTEEELGFKDESSHWECKLLVTFFVYTLVASTFWLTLDAHVLMKLIDVDLRYLQKNKYTCLHIAIGWVGPLAVVIPWVLFRIFTDDYLCWNTNPKSWTVWIYRVPIVLMNLANVKYFIKIVRFMYQRMKRNHSKRNTNNYRSTVLKMTKHICILIPLFGVPYIVFTVMAIVSDAAYLYAEMFFSSFQGFLLAITLCFTDKRVVQEFRQIFLRCGTTKPRSEIGRKMSQLSTTTKTVLSDS